MIREDDKFTIFYILLYLLELPTVLTTCIQREREREREKERERERQRTIPEGGFFSLSFFLSL